MSHDTGQGVDDWRALATTISPRSPRLSSRGDLAYVATDDPAVGGRVRIVPSRRRRGGRHRPRSRHRRGAHRAHPALVPRRPATGVRRRPSGHRRGPRRRSRRDRVHDDLAGPGLARRGPALDRRGVPRRDRRPAEQRLGGRARVAARHCRQRPDDVGQRQRASAGWPPSTCATGHIERLDTVPADGVGDVPARPWPVRRDRLGRTDRVRLVRRSAVGAGRHRDERVLHVPQWQIAAPRVSPDGTRIALVEGWASDRGYVAGDVVVIDLVGHSSTTWSIDGVDVIGLDWLDDEQLRFHGWHDARSAHGVVAADGTVASVDRRRRRAARADGRPRRRRADRPRR